MKLWLQAKWWAVREWCERVIYCHHNARVLADMEYRFACVLDHATGGQMSKPYYEIDTMYAQIDDHISRCCDEAYQEGYTDARDEFEKVE